METPDRARQLVAHTHLLLGHTGRGRHFRKLADQALDPQLALSARRAYEGLPG